MFAVSHSIRFESLLSSLLTDGDSETEKEGREEGWSGIIKHIYTSCNTTNPGMDMPLSSGQTSVHSGHTYVQTQVKYFRFSRKKNCQKLKNGQKVYAVKYLLKIKTPSCIEFRKGKSLDIKVSNLDRRLSNILGPTYVHVGQTYVHVGQACVQSPL